MRDGGQIVVDADRVIELLDGIRREVNERIDDLGRFLAEGMTTEPPTPTRQRKAQKAAEGPPFELRSFDIDAVDWKRKDSTPAGPNEVWAWGFATDQEGFIHDEVADLFNACNQYGEVRVGSYLIKIGGRDKNLLNRKKLATKRR